MEQKPSPHRKRGQPLGEKTEANLTGNSQNIVFNYRYLEVFNSLSSLSPTILSMCTPNGIELNFSSPIHSSKKVANVRACVYMCCARPDQSGS